MCNASVLYFYCDLVFNFRKIVGRNNFSDQFVYVIIRSNSTIMLCDIMHNLKKEDPLEIQYPKFENS